MLRHSIFGSICVVILLCATMAFVAADGPETQDVTVTFTDDGELTVSLSASGGGGDPTFGVVDLDALDDVARTLDLELTYTDTHTERGGGVVTLSATTLLPTSPIPPFLGSDQVDFQIPDRYLELTTLGPVEPDEPVACDTPGDISSPDDLSAVEGTTFDGDVPLTIAEVDAGCGVGSATQAITLTLTVPAGAYPTDYSTVITVETTVDETS